MIRERSTSMCYAISRWLLNATVFVSILLSSDVTQQPQYFQSNHTELVVAVRNASRNTVAYKKCCDQSDLKEIDSLNSLVHIQIHYSSRLRIELKNALFNIPAVPIAVRYLQHHSNLSASDEDEFLSLRG